MKSNMIWANFAVEDLDHTTEFYVNLGFKSNGRSQGLTSFSFGDNGFVINFFLKDILSKNTNVNISNQQESNEVIFTLSAETREEVNNWAEKVKTAGGKLNSNPEEFGDEYYGFVFSDPDGHKFNLFMM
ncbi:VOC family protein [Chryseobacterium sp.]|jgi:predicted lactoylglutathione lyase|uniref:VOC family protein n=1 Tax=Chryseobacterium sp. TaxID=1871047 RepID=UPI00262F6612|nr:VOC family protein [Chryseobacterium sp.]